MITLQEWLAQGRALALSVVTSHVLWSTLLVAVVSGASTAAIGVTYHDPIRVWLENHNFIAAAPTAASVTYVDRSAAVISRVDVLATTAASQTKQLDQVSRQLDALLGKIELARTDIAQAHQRTSDALLAIPERSGVVTRAALQSVIVVRRESPKPTAAKAAAQ
jgi:hypothetical protein